MGKDGKEEEKEKDNCVRRVGNMGILQGIVRGIKRS